MFNCEMYKNVCARPNRVSKNAKIKQKYTPSQRNKSTKPPLLEAFQLCDSFTYSALDPLNSLDSQFTGSYGRIVRLCCPFAQ